MTRAQRRALETLWPKFGIGDDVSLLTAIGLFGNQRPLTLEIGLYYFVPTFLAKFD